MYVKNLKNNAETDHTECTKLLDTLISEFTERRENYQGLLYQSDNPPSNSEYPLVKRSQICEILARNLKKSPALCSSQILDFDVFKM